MNSSVSTKDDFIKRIESQFRVNKRGAKDRSINDAETRRSLMDAPSFIAWLREEREKLLLDPVMSQYNNVWKHHVTDDPATAAREWAEYFEFAEGTPINWSEMWHLAAPTLSNTKRKDRPVWRYHSEVEAYLKAIRIIERVKVLTEYLETTKTAANAASGKMFIASISFEELFVSDEKMKEALDLACQIGLINNNNQWIIRTREKQLAALWWIWKEREYVHVLAMSDIEAIKIVAVKLTGKPTGKNTWNKFTSSELKREANRLLREERE